MKKRGKILALAAIGKNFSQSIFYSSRIHFATPKFGQVCTQIRQNVSIHVHLFFMAPEFSCR